MARTALFLCNDPEAPPATLGEVFAESGFDVRTFAVVAPAQTDDPVHRVEFPDPADYDVIVPLGARWAVYDPRLARSWVADEIDMVRRARDVGVGVLGVCFGGQLLATALGGTVARAPQPEIGWHEVHSSRPDLVPGGAWFQWHFDRFTVPPGAIALAENSCAPQAFLHSGSQAPALGLQFHPEVDQMLLERWIEADSDGDLRRAGISADALRERTAVEVAGAARRLRQLVGGFVELLDEHSANRAHRAR